MDKTGCKDNENNLYEIKFQSNLKIVYFLNLPNDKIIRDIKQAENLQDILNSQDADDNLKFELYKMISPS